jgi:hypothetical protein
MSSELWPVLHYAQGLSVIITVFYVALLNSSTSCLIFGIVTNTGRPNSAASSRRKYLLSQARGLLALPASNAKGHAMRAALIVLMLMFGSQVGA